MGEADRAVSRPGTRFFIGPLTPAQRRRRERSRARFGIVDDIAYTRNIPMADAFRAAHYQEKFPISYRYFGYATGEYP